MEFTVLCAWQADRPNDVNRYFIRDAIKAAISGSGADVEDTPRLDHDTEGVPRTPPIATTIFEKITKCGIFVADATLVAEWTCGESTPALEGGRTYWDLRCAWISWMNREGPCGSA